MATLIHDTTVVSGDVAQTVHHEAAILIEGDRVAAVGSSAEIVARRPTAERIDGRGRTVFPGFANAHTHLPMTIARGIYEDQSPPHRPPFLGGLARLPLPALSGQERQVMALLGAWRRSARGPRWFW